MRLGKVAFAIVLGCCATAQAEENVFVDLSVLDSLNGAYTAPREPLFPVLPKQKKKVRPAIKKPVIKKHAPAKIKPAPVEVRPQEEVKSLQDLPEIKPVEEPKVVVVDVEPVSGAAPIAPLVTEEIPAAKVPEIAVEPVSQENEQPLLQSAPVVSVAAEVQELVEPKVEMPQPELLIDETPAPQAALSDADKSIVFADGQDELTTEQMSKIDDIIGRFKDVNANKIAIYSYNLDDGVDSFRKKRISLNRAVEIRGYLIKQGYKNFSIKVININSGSDKINTVELEEI